MEMLESVLGEFREQQEAAIGAYRQLVAAIVDEKEPGVDVEATLAASGKTVDDLKRDVETLRKWRAAVDIVRTEPEVTKKSEALQKAIEDHQQERADYYYKWVEKHQELHRKAGEFRERHKEIEAARQKLLELNPEVAAQIHAVDAEDNQLRSEQEKNRKTIRSLEARIEFMRLQAKQGEIADMPTGSVDRMVNEVRAEITRLQERQEEIHARREELKRERRKLWEHLLAAGPLF